MDLAHLEVFTAVVEEQHFSRAAARLARTQAAVSQTIKKLESDLGVALLDRNSKGVITTEAGRLLYDYARRLLDLRDEAAQALRRLDELTAGRLVIGANEQTVTYILPWLERFIRTHPAVRVEVKRCRASDVSSELLRHGVELGVISFAPPEAGLRALTVATDAVALVTAPDHPLAKRQSVSIRELGQEVFIAHNIVSRYRLQVVEAFARHRTPLRIAVELPSIEAIKRMVEAGVGVSALPRLCVAAEVERGQLAAIPVREMRLARKLRVVYRAQSPLSRAAQAFVDLARAAKDMKAD
ncbi:MAG: LysR family transcriptional regulator [Chloracidobacterium sp. CP2_5A]|nr:MAG: LysR family transcriptional regulator [Chloracidobacterium sp. CP2_5A]